MSYSLKPGVVTGEAYKTLLKAAKEIAKNYNIDGFKYLFYNVEKGF